MNGKWEVGGKEIIKICLKKIYIKALIIGYGDNYLLLSVCAVTVD